ncbi:Aldehyde dehydrogenase, mitochondrial [Fonsecaea pedrosoi]|nr:Aldehyde dehydrogenase, mitochondrial [Fonsecaea pedrosoi]
MGSIPAFETRLFINGQYVNSKSATRMSCYTPADNTPVTEELHVAEKDDVDDAVNAARTAFKLWKETSSATRAALLLRIADRIEAHAKEFARLEALCTGKPVAQSLGFEVPMAAKVFRYYAGWCDKLSGEAWPQEGTGFLRMTRREPLGVCAAVNAFNGPLVMIAMKGAPCLAAGNTMIVKSSEKTPLTTVYFGKILQEAGAPDGIMNLITGPGSTGALLASHLDIDKISFTGSSATGKKIAQMASTSNMKKVTLELGGKSPSIIFDDAQLDNAAQWCMHGILGNSGQACIASSRVYVQKGVKEVFVAKLKALFEQMTPAFGQDANSDDTRFPPLADKAQFDRVQSYMDIGSREGTLVTGGKPIYDKGCWIAPTIFVDTKPSARIYKEEIFGPVVVVNEFEEEEDVLNRANDTEFGLAGAVFTQDVNRAMRIAAKVEAGTVCINCCTMVDVTVPFGGMKQSGWGRELGKT